MREYLLKRVLLMLPTLFLVTILVFLMMRLIPGDVVLQMLEGYAYADSVEALRRELGLDKPIHIQYLEWMNGLLRGNLGHSLWTKESIVAEFARRFPVTLELALLTISVSVTFGVGVGVLSAVRQESWLDYIGRVVAILALAMPYFWLAIMVVVLPAIYFRWTPLWTYVPLTTDPLENLKILVIAQPPSENRLTSAL
jgi:peptide/nickel transport system permease protein